MTASPDRAIHGTPTAARRHAFRRVVTVQGGSIAANELGFSIAGRIAIEPSVLMVQPRL